MKLIQLPGNSRVRHSSRNIQNFLTAKTTTKNVDNLLANLCQNKPIAEDNKYNFLQQNIYTSPKFRIDRQKAESIMQIRYEAPGKKHLLSRGLLGPGSLLNEEKQKRSKQSTLVTEVSPTRRPTGLKAL